MHSNLRRIGAGALAGAAALCALHLAACVGHGVYSHDPEERGNYFNNPNDSPVHDVLAEAVRWTICRYPDAETVAAMHSPPPEPVPWGKPPEVVKAEPMAARYAVSLVPGMTRGAYLAAVRSIGQGTAPLSAETASLPTYYVGRILINGDEAKVEVFKPVLDMIGADGRPVHQCVSLNLRGGMHEWTVTSHKVWTIGSIQPPPPSYLPEKGRRSGPSKEEVAALTAPANAQPAGEPAPGEPAADANPPGDK